RASIKANQYHSITACAPRPHQGGQREGEAEEARSVQLYRSGRHPSGMTRTGKAASACQHNAMISARSRCVNRNNLTGKFQLGVVAIVPLVLSSMRVRESRLIQWGWGVVCPLWC